MPHKGLLIHLNCYLYLFLFASTLLIGYIFVLGPIDDGIDDSFNKVAESKRKSGANSNTRATTLNSLDDIFSKTLCQSTTNCVFQANHLPPFGLKFSKDELRRLRQLYETTILVVAFNRKSVYYVAPLVQFLYGRIFKEIVYCGPSPNRRTFSSAIADIFGTSILSDFFESAYINYETVEYKPVIQGVGEMIYSCVYLAVGRLSKLKPSLDVSGVFLVHDDAMFNYWHFLFGQNTFDLSKSYTLAKRLIYDIDSLKGCMNINSSKNLCDQTLGWMWPPLFKNSVSAFFKDLTSLSKEEKTKDYQQCLSKIAKQTNGQRRAIGGLTDMFYVSKNSFPIAIPLFELAAKRKVFQEIAVPTIFACLNDTKVGGLPIGGFGKGQSPWQLFDTKQVLVHPFKLSQIVRASFNETIRNATVLDTCLVCSLAQYSKFLALSREKEKM